MKVIVFAGLKDFFETEFEIEAKPSTISELRTLLEKSNPASTELLKKCRFAVNNTFVTLDENIENVSEVLIMPPSSGG